MSRRVSMARNYARTLPSAIKSSLCKIPQNDPNAVKPKRFLPSTRPSLQDFQTSPATSGKSLTGWRNHPSTRPSLQDAAAPADDRARAVSRDCARNTRGAPTGRRTSTPGDARPSSAAPAPGSTDSRDHWIAWLAASVACARAGMPASGKTAAWALVDVAGTSGRTMRIVGTPWTAPDRRTFHSLPNKTHGRHRQPKRRGDSAYINGGSILVSRGGLKSVSAEARSLGWLYCSGWHALTPCPNVLWRPRRAEIHA